MFLRYAVALVATYFVTWTLSYVLIFISYGDGLDFSYFFEYLMLAWTFRAGELPSFIWLFSIAAFLPLALLVVFLLRRYAGGAPVLRGLSGDGSRHI
jgi:hypothetical protein